tara:strand:- start:727 stop:1737 length:1011 start_codon:yes stop_codon:yes gene_type:complete
MSKINVESVFILLIVLFALAIVSYSYSPSTTESMRTNSNKTYSESSENSETSDNSTTQNRFDNYNHYTGTSNALKSGTTFYGGNGGKVVVSSDGSGTQTLTVTLSSGGENPLTLTTKNSNNSKTTFYGDNGASATVTTSENGQQAIKVKTTQGTTVFTESGAVHKNDNGELTSSQYYGSTGTSIQPNSASYYNDDVSAGSATGPGGNTAYYASGPNGNTAVGTTSSASSSSGSATGPRGNTAYYASGPNGNSAVGINASQIPAGQEDLYMLKSQIVPPVCPVCPSPSLYPRNEPCPACPACARCPEPAFECKKVPNYNSINEDYLPQPVVNDFSSF